MTTIRARQSSTHVRVAVLCSGLDSVLRGYETHTRHLFEHLKPLLAERGDTITLFKRDGETRPDEVVLHVPDRDSGLVDLLTKLRGLERARFILDARSRYYWEHVFFSARFAGWCLANRAAFDRILTIEQMVAAHVFKARHVLPGNPFFIYTHGLSLQPRHYLHIADRIHEVSIENFERAKLFAGDDQKLRLIPHFLPENAGSEADRAAIRRELGITTERVLMSAGVIERHPKRMDYLIDEAAQLGPEWTLLLCGPPEDGALLELGKQRLGARFVHHLLPREKIAAAYLAADVFALASLEEGFGIVLLEAMRAGIAVIAHDRPLFRWVTKDECLDLTKPRAIAKHLAALTPEKLREKGDRNRRTFEEHYTWRAVQDAYLELIDHAT